MIAKFLDQQYNYRYRSGDAGAKPIEFYNKVLPCTKLYCRAVGFFSSTSFLEISYGILSLVKNEGKMLLITSPRLNEDDVEAIKKGYESRENVYLNAFKREISLPKTINEQNRLNILANLIENGILEIKIAVTQNPEISMYHEKIGLFVDCDGNKIAISGSMNESETAISENFESFQVFCGWKMGEDERVKTCEDDFYAMWKNEQNSLEVFDFPELPRELIKAYKTEALSKSDLEQKADLYAEEPSEPCVVHDSVLARNVPTMPSWLKLHDYQNEAVENWRKQNYCGIFDMATGTGKTLTGLSALTRLYEDTSGAICVIILCPYIHLVTQWVEDIEKFNIKPIVAFGSSPQKDWKDKFERAVYKRNEKDGGCGFFCLITTVATFKRDTVQKYIGRLRKDILLIADEAHNLGSLGAKKFLEQEKFRYRLALSATLDRHFDESGTSALYDFFGQKCIQYGLRQAIDEGYLTPYKYYPILVCFDDDERDAYIELTKSISLEIKKDTKTGKVKLTERGKLLCILRSKIIASCHQKIPALISALRPFSDQNMILIYCGAVKFDEDFSSCADDVDDSAIKQIDEVIRRVYDEYQMKICRFTAETKIAEREVIKQKLAEGRELQAVAAIKCLDEGVNIPSIKTAFILASSTNPKEYIQRRGRVLRTFEGKDFAEIFDFITMPYELDAATFKTDFEKESFQALVKNELERMKEFSSLAENSIESIELMKVLKEKFCINENTKNLEEVLYE